MAVIKHEEQRVGIFIDAQNLYHSAKNLYGRKVNFGSVVEDALSGRKLIRSIAYVITSETGEEKGFFEALEKMGIETKTKDLQIFYGGAKKADWDVGLAVDAIKMSKKLDTIIIISGDGDFIPLVEYLKMNGCQVEATSFKSSSSSKLIETVDDFIDLDEDPKKYLIGYNTRRKVRKKSESTKPKKKTEIIRPKDKKVEIIKPQKTEDKKKTKTTRKKNK
jgi:uncharacterized LabA/DUF88 family protein